MNEEVKKFIEENIRLIESNSWSKVYEKAKNNLEEKTGQFTEIMLDAGIHPEYFMSKIPSYFLDWSGIKSFIIPENVTEIGVLGFAHCSKLADITIPNNVIAIGNYGFYSCGKLSNITIGEEVTSIGSHAFTFCESLRDITIPANVAYIGHQAFALPWLYTLTIENPNITICSSSFARCRDLEIQFNGTKEQWKTVSKGKFEGVTYTCNCTDGILKKSR